MGDGMDPSRAEGWTRPAAVALAAALGLALAADSALRSSATYDEVAYLRVAARWWRTGDQEAITRMGSPLTFWKWQQAPTLWAIDRAGFGPLIDRPIEHQAALLPLVRLGALHVWLVAFLLTVAWARALHGPGGMALAAWLFALSPNLLAHGSLVTMELPLVACTAGIFLAFWLFLKAGRSSPFWVSAALSGLAVSCKFTAVLYPPILGLAWALELRRQGWIWERIARRVGVGMIGFLAVMALGNLAVTGFAMLPPSERTGPHPALDGRFGVAAARLAEWPLPQDMVGFAIQARHQRSGGPSYLLGERRLTGWWYYYLVALAVKVPLSFWLLASSRFAQGRREGSSRGDLLIPTAIGSFLVITALGSTRNYGVRYLLPLAPMAIAWVSGLAEGPRWARRAAWVGLAGQALAVAAIHPHELSYFNALAGGPIGGRRILADSCLDWGQGARSLARLQARRPEFRDLTFYGFGETDPAHYGVVGRRYVVDATDRHPGLPAIFAAETPYVAVSASLQWGPWGPAGYFRALDGVRPVAFTDDWTIAVYRTADLPRRAPGP